MDFENSFNEVLEKFIENIIYNIYYINFDSYIKWNSCKNIVGEIKATMELLVQGDDLVRVVVGKCLSFQIHQCAP